MNIKKKLILTTVSAIVFTSTILTFIASQAATDSIEKRLYNTELPSVLLSVTEGVEKSLTTPLVVSKALATNPDYLPLIQNGELDAHSQQVSQYLTSVKNEYDALTAFFIPAQSGNYYTERGRIKTLSSQKASDQWFYQFLQSGKPYALSLDIDSESNIAVLFINYAIKNNGNTIGVAGIGLPLAEMTEMIKAYKIGEQGQVFLTDAAGVIQLHRSQASRDKTLSDYFDQPMPNFLNKTTIQISSLSGSNGDQIVASQYLPLLDWFVVAELSADEVFQDTSELTRTLILVGVGITILFTAIATWLITTVINPLNHVGKMLEEISSGEGDLTRRLDDSTNDEIGALSGSYNRFVESLAQMLEQVQSTSSQLLNGVKSIDVQMNNISQDVLKQQSQTEMMATAIQEMGHTADEIASNANHAAQSTTQIDVDAVDGHQSVEETISHVTEMESKLESTTEVIQQLAEEAVAINSMLEVIHGISEQTNLLALNAAIEAARAGDQGRGFAVVADEVRTLALRSNQSTGEIKTIIERLQHKSDQSVQAMESGVKTAEISKQLAITSGKKLTEISSSIQNMNDMNIQIATATEEQTSVVAEVSNTVTDIASIAESNATYAKQAGMDCDELRAQAAQLEELVSRFKLS
ncbi:methyl-accepting chemotaxis protein [Aliivibrio kagoshimensis]|uniref:methyl-accepting chemotaxis protein n=1 Tax=Aliivibrio kagoshimensis TaxID=2910230 RepID=UPI003D0AA3FB